jgi:hypothetical protein
VLSRSRLEDPPVGPGDHFARSLVGEPIPTVVLLAEPAEGWRRAAGYISAVRQLREHEIGLDLGVVPLTVQRMPV